jgi:hypothetical protein
MGRGGMNATGAGARNGELTGSQDVVSRTAGAALCGADIGRTISRSKDESLKIGSAADTSLGAAFHWARKGEYGCFSSAADSFSKLVTVPGTICPPDWTPGSTAATASRWLEKLKESDMFIYYLFHNLHNHQHKSYQNFKNFNLCVISGIHIFLMLRDIFPRSNPIPRSSG